MSAADFFPTLDDPTLAVSVSYKLEDADLTRILKSLLK